MTRCTSITAAALLLLMRALPVDAVDTSPPRKDEPGVVGISAGAEFSSGDYGTGKDTDIWYFPFTLRYETERWLWRVTVPYLIVQNEAGVVISSGHGMGGHSSTTTTSTTTKTQSGLGDVVAAASYTLQKKARQQPALDVTGKIYFGTANENKGLGTGQNDYAVQLDVAQDVAAVELFGSAGYRVTGDPAGVTYKDVLYGTFGAEHNYAARDAVGVALDAQQPYVSGADPFLQLTGYLALRPARDTKFTLYLLLGLSDAAPDAGLGGVFTWYY
jgi:hypothetical protein